VTRILIAEDEGQIASFLERGLRANGFATEVVADGNEALRMARSGRFDLLILDLGLPRLDGIEVLRELRGEGRRLPVVILTARAGIDDTVLGLEGGADDYMTKPFRFDELLARVRARTTAR
jgi:DNA-binding response OmpR family regulator